MDKNILFQNKNKFLIVIIIIVLGIILISYLNVFVMTGKVVLDLKITKSSQKISNTTGNFNEPLNNNTYFGNSVTSIGDLDNDNITDIVVGAYQDDDGGTNRGAIYVLFMYQNGSVKSSQKISNTTGNFNEPLNDSDYFGNSVTSIGDLDNDNITDIVVGADGDDDGGGQRGAVYVLFMYENGTVKSSQKISDTQGNFNEILNNTDRFGSSVTSIGDLDNDNITDIVVGADGDDDGGFQDRGAVYVLFMYQNGSVKSSQKISDTEGNFNEILNASDEFGNSVTSIGDLDNDNITDIVVSAYQDDDGGASINSNKGAVYVLFMYENGTIKSSQKISDTEGNFNEILNDSDYFGNSVTSIGDLDNDNITDIVVGAYQDDDGGGYGRGAVYVLFMYQNGSVKSSQKISNTTGNFNEPLDDGDSFGNSVTSIGDLDNDNITDIVVSAYQDDDGGNNRGAVYVLFLNEVMPPNITLNSPSNNSYLSSDSVNFNASVVDQSGIINVSLILDGIYNETNSSGINNTDYIFTKTLLEGAHNWTYEVCDTINNCLSVSIITFTIDTTFPLINYTTGTENNNSNVSQNWIFINVTVTEANEDTIIFNLFNSTQDTVNSTSFTDSTRTINWTGLSDGTYYYNVTINDSVGNSNSTETRKITLDTTSPINYVSPTENSGAYKSRDYIEINVTSPDTNLDTITIRLYNSTNDSIKENTSITSPFYINYSNLLEGIYSYNVTSNDSLSNENSTQTRIITLDTTSPTITFACTPSSVTVGGTVTCTCSGSDGNGSGIDTTSYTSNPSSSSTGTFTETCIVTDNAGNSANVTASYIVTSSTGNGGSGNFTPQPPEEIHIWTKITPGVAAIMKDLDEEIGIKQIQIEVNNEAQNVKITVTKHEGKPANVSVEKSGKVYQYLQIETENLEDKLKKGVVTIRVNKSWVSENNLDKDKIAMFKFINNKWTELETNYTNENTYYFYDIELDSFSYFAVGGKVVTEEIIEEIEEGEEVEEQKGLILFYVLIMILVVAIVLVVVLIGRLIVKSRRTILAEIQKPNFML